MAKSESTARERIVETAGSMFAERGFDGVSVADIAAASGISTGLIYYHFKDKQALYESVVRESVHLLEDAAIRTLGQQGRPIERIRAFIAEYMRLLEDELDVMRLLVRTFTDSSGHVPEHVLMRTASTIDRVQAVIEEGIEAGEFRTVDSHLAATALFALVNTLVTARVLEAPRRPWTDTTVEQQAAFMTELFLEGVARCS